VRYDVLGESVALIEGRLQPARDVRLSRRRRHLPMCVDTVGDVAATVFASRGVSGEPCVDLHFLVRSTAGWRLLGGGSGPGELRYTHQERWVKPRRGYCPSSAGVAAPGGRWLSAALVLTDGSVAALRTHEPRDVSVAANGAACLIWEGDTPPQVSLLSDTGDVVESLDLGTQLRSLGRPEGAPLPGGPGP
jgi:hypothetical protein